MIIKPEHALKDKPDTIIIFVELAKEIKVVTGLQKNEGQYLGFISKITKITK